MKERVAELGAERATRPEFKVAVGDPATVIQETAEGSGEPTLVAVGSRGLDAVGRFALGSVFTDTLRTAGGPVLVFPSSMSDEHSTGGEGIRETGALPND